MPRFQKAIHARSAARGDRPSARSREAWCKCRTCCDEPEYTYQRCRDRGSARGACSRCRSCAAGERSAPSGSSAPRQDPSRLADRAAEDVRGPGGNRDRERAAVQGARGAQSRSPSRWNGRRRQRDAEASSAASQVDVQPVFDTVIDDAPRSCATRSSATLNVSTDVAARRGRPSSRPERIDDLRGTPSRSARDRPPAPPRRRREGRHGTTSSPFPVPARRGPGARRLPDDARGPDDA